MNETAHALATGHIPSFVTGPGETDVLMVIMSFVLVGAVFGIGVLFLRLHSLPERMAHRGHKIQFEIVAVLCLIALFTHMHIFWIAALLLAMVDMPDFGTSLSRIADSTETMARIPPDRGRSTSVADGSSENSHEAQIPSRIPPVANSADGKTLSG